MTGSHPRVLDRGASPAAHLTPAEFVDNGRAVLDWLSLHFYWNELDYEGALAGPIASEAEICDTWGLIGAAKRRRKLNHDLRICIDEWGVWPEPYLSMAHQPEVINRRLRAELKRFA